jgi:sulfoxide reductase heme-binding subunit YedZ
MAATSNDYAVKVMGANWKRLQLLVYPAILLVIVHFVSLGAIFAKKQVLIAAILIALAAVLFLKFKPK